VAAAAEAAALEAAAASADLDNQPAAKRIKSDN